MELCPRCGAGLPEGSQECLACAVAEVGQQDGLSDPLALPEEAAADVPLLIVPPPGALPERWERLLATPGRRRVTRRALSTALVALLLLVSVSAWSAFVHSAWGARLSGMNEVVFAGGSLNPLAGGRASIETISCITTVTTSDGGTSNKGDPSNCVNQQVVMVQPISDGTVNAASKSGLYLTRPDGTGLRRLTNVPDGAYFSPVWSPDGAQIAAFVIYPVPGYIANLVIMNADGSHAHIIPAVSLMLGSFYQGISEVASPLAKLISWSPDSSQLAAPVGNGQFALINADGTHLRQLTGSQPTWAPDGRSLAYYVHTAPDSDSTNGGLRSSFPDPTLRIEVLNLQTGQKRDLQTLTNVSGDALAWSPDGRFLAYSMASLDRTQSLPVSAVMLAGADGSDPRMVAQWNGGLIEQISWSPDARQLAVVVDDVVLTNGDSGFTTQQDLWVVNTDQSHPRDLGACDSNQPSWSPDGRHLIFTNQVDPIHTSVLIVADTGVSPAKEQKLALHIPFAFAPSWSPLAGL